jgi:hypothetical protein
MVRFDLVVASLHFDSISRNLKNYGDRWQSRSCEVVPPREAPSQKFPCQYIPLNETGETVTSLYSYGTQEELEEAVAQWLRATIGWLEKGLARAA